jgi:hypothetical protein
MRIRGASLACLLGLALVGPISTKVEAQANWYPPDCHGGASICRRALYIDNRSRGRYITTSRGVVYVSYNFPRRLSRDRRTHVCTVRTGGRLRPTCLFVGRASFGNGNGFTPIAGNGNGNGTWMRRLPADNPGNGHNGNGNGPNGNGEPSVPNGELEDHTPMK